MAQPFDFDAAADAAGREFNVNPALIKAIGMQESGLNPNAPRGAAGEIGMMQIMPATAADLGVNPADPADAVRGTAKYLAQGLAQAETMRAQGIDVDPATHAVMYYNGGPGGWHNAEGYAQSVGGHYQRLAGPGAPLAMVGMRSGGDQGVGDQGPADQGAGPPNTFLIPGTDQPARPLLPGRPLIHSRGAIPLPADLDALAASGSAAQPMPSPPPAALRSVGAQPMPSPGVAALAGVGATPAAGGSAGPAGGPVPAPTGAGGSEPPLDIDGIVNGLASGKLTAPPPVPPPAPAPRGAPVTAAGPAAAPTGAPAGGAPQAAIDVPSLVQTYNQYRSFPAGVQIANTVLGMLQKMAPEGFQVNIDGSLSARPGFAEGQAQVAGAKTAAEQQEQLRYAGPIAGAKATAEQEQQRITAAVAPQRVRAGEGVFYPPGSPAAGAAQPAAPGGGEGAPGVLTQTPGGGATIAGTAPAQATETFYKRFDELAKEADSARTGMYQADLLKQQLHALPQTGPTTEYLGQLSAWAQAMGVPQDKLPTSFPKPGDVEAANKLSTDLLGEVLRAQFPGRITNTDIQTMAPTIARVQTPMAANDFLLDRVLRPKFQRDIDRYGHVASLPQADPTLASLSTRLYDWDQNPDNSISAYAERAQKAAAAAAPTPATPGGAAPPIARPETAPPQAPAAPRRRRFDPATGAFSPVQ